jgi:hypothetical protein
MQSQLGIASRAASRDQLCSNSSRKRKSVLLIVNNSFRPSVNANKALSSALGLVVEPETKITPQFGHLSELGFQLAGG